MIGALGLMFTTIVWFVGAFFMMFVSPTIEWLVLVPFTGMLALTAGVFVWIHSRRKDIFLFLLSPLASLLVVFVSGLFRGALTDEAATNLSIAFLAVQAVFLVFAIYRCRTGWRTAVLIAYGFAAFAVFSALIAVMAFVDSWI